VCGFKQSAVLNYSSALKNNTVYICCIQSLDFFMPKIQILLSLAEKTDGQTERKWELVRGNYMEKHA